MFHKKLFVTSGIALLCCILALSIFMPRQAFAASTTRTAAQIAQAACPATVGYGYETHGSAVLLLQEFLNDEEPARSDNTYPYPYTYPLAQDSYFGPQTYNAVRDFQWWNSLSVDGIAGPQTWGSLLGGC